MRSVLTIRLNTTPAQAERLAALQSAFAQACNVLAPIVQETRCWNRVALHHLAYRKLREEVPLIGSQMACNAIYSVARMARLVFQHPRSPFNIARLGEQSLPRLQFMPSAPVYFDRHTLSVKNGKLSMYTLDGRLHFDLCLSAADEARFHEEKLREIILRNDAAGATLAFHFSSDEASDAQPADPGFPEYLVVTPSDRPASISAPPPLSAPQAFAVASN